MYLASEQSLNLVPASTRGSAAVADAARVPVDALPTLAVLDDPQEWSAFSQLADRDRGTW